MKKLVFVMLILTGFSLASEMSAQTLYITTSIEPAEWFDGAFARAPLVWENGETMVLTAEPAYIDKDEKWVQWYSTPAFRRNGERKDRPYRWQVTFDPNSPRSIGGIGGYTFTVFTEATQYTIRSFPWDGSSFEDIVIPKG